MKNPRHYFIAYSIIMSFSWGVLLFVTSIIAYFNGGIVIVDFNMYGENLFEIFFILAIMIIAVLSFIWYVRGSDLNE